MEREREGGLVGRERESERKINIFVTERDSEK